MLLAKAEGRVHVGWEQPNGRQLALYNAANMLLNKAQNPSLYANDRFFSMSSYIRLAISEVMFHSMFTITMQLVYSI